MARARSTASSTCFSALIATPRKLALPTQSEHGRVVPGRGQWGRDGKARPAVSESLPCGSSAERTAARKDSPDSTKERIAMLMTKERGPAIRTLLGWAIGVLQEV